MSYILGLLFSYSRYKHDAVVRIYADDHLVDELRLTDNINLKTIKYDNMPIWDQGNINLYNGEFSRVLIVPEKLYLFEIKDKYLNSRLRIEVENSNKTIFGDFFRFYSRAWHQIT